MKYCESCGKELADYESICPVCGEQQTGSIAVESKDNSKKKKILVPVVIIGVLVIIVIVFCFILFGDDKKDDVDDTINTEDTTSEEISTEEISSEEVTTEEITTEEPTTEEMTTEETISQSGSLGSDSLIEDFGMLVNGEFYNFNYQYGLENYQGIEGGLVEVMSSDASTWDRMKFTATGSDTSIFIEQLATATWFCVEENIENYEKDTSRVTFYFREGYQIDGVNGRATEEDFQDAGYVSLAMYATEDGNVDVSLYYEDFEKIKEENTFTCLPYSYMLMETYRYGEYVASDDVEGLLNELEEKDAKGQHGGTDDFVLTLCSGDLRYQYSNGDIDMIIVKSITLATEGVDADNLLTIAMMTDADTVKIWEENWRKSWE